jgi:hypothetical protein
LSFEIENVAPYFPCYSIILHQNFISFTLHMWKLHRFHMNYVLIPHMRPTIYAFITCVIWHFGGPRVSYQQYHNCIIKAYIITRKSRFTKLVSLYRGCHIIQQRIKEEGLYYKRTQTERTPAAILLPQNC